MSYAQVTFTINDAAVGDAIVASVLEQRLAACTQKVGPIESRYWWDGAIESATEWLYLCKTTGAAAPALIQAIKAAHPSETPEVIATDITGSPEYLWWIQTEIS